MGIIFYVESDTLIAALSGEIDHHVAEKLRNDIDREMAMCDTKNLIFDFRDVVFMDSSGIGMVLGRYKKVHNAGGRVRLNGSSFSASSSRSFLANSKRKKSSNPHHSK